MACQLREKALQLHVLISEFKLAAQQKSGNSSLVA